MVNGLMTDIRFGERKREFDKLDKKYENLLKLVKEYDDLTSSIEGLRECVQSTAALYHSECMLMLVDENDRTEDFNNYDERTKEQIDRVKKDIEELTNNINNMINICN